MSVVQRLTMRDGIGRPSMVMERALFRHQALTLPMPACSKLANSTMTTLSSDSLPKHPIVST